MMLLVVLQLAIILSHTLGEEQVPLSDMVRLKDSLSKNYDATKPDKDTIVYIVFIPTFMRPVRLHFRHL
jgi:hypothetical protein